MFYGSLFIIVISLNTNMAASSGAQKRKRIKPAEKRHGDFLRNVPRARRLCKGGPLISTVPGPSNSHFNPCSTQCADWDNERHKRGPLIHNDDRASSCDEEQASTFVFFSLPAMTYRHCTNSLLYIRDWQCLTLVTMVQKTKRNMTTGINNVRA